MFLQQSNKTTYIVFLTVLITLFKFMSFYVPINYVSLQRILHSEGHLQLITPYLVILQIARGSRHSVHPHTSHSLPLLIILMFRPLYHVFCLHRSQSILPVLRVHPPARTTNALKNKSSLLFLAIVSFSYLTVVTAVNINILKVCHVIIVS